MTPHRSNQRGTFKLDRRFPGIGRINRASGTKNTKLYSKINEMLTNLYEVGRWDLVRAVRDGHISPLEMWGAYKHGQTNLLPTAKHVAPLAPAVARWLRRADISEPHRANYRHLFDQLTGPKTSVCDLPKLLEGFRDRCEQAGHARTFNLARSGCKAFVGQTLGREDHLYHELDRIPQLREVKRKGKKLTIDEVADIAARLGHHGSVWWGLCVTGMRPRSEYWGEWELGEDRIYIHGMKRRASERIVPRLFSIALPTTTYWGFVQAIRKVTGGTVRPYDARHTFMHWMEMSGIPRIRRKIYLGHELGADVSELYEEHDVVAFLEEDANRLREYLGEAPRSALRVVR